VQWSCLDNQQRTGPGAHCACPARSTEGRSRPRSAARQTAAWPAARRCWPAAWGLAARSRPQAAVAEPTWAAGWLHRRNAVTG
jgi:hypothetical protein